MITGTTRRRVTDARERTARTLVVEDERDVAELLRYNLAKEGFDVIVAPHGADALVWGRDGFVEPRTVDVHLARLRAKFIAARATAPAIETVRGVGYRFKDPSDS